MDFITLTPENLAKEHICCALSDTQPDGNAAAKKAWLSQRLGDGLVFTKLNAKAKVFIEYLPGEMAWAPVRGDGYLYINCFWVSGKYQGKGYGSRLLEGCLADARAQGRQGVMVLSSPKKRPFLSDPAFLKKKGFLVADTAEPYFELLYLPLQGGAPPPAFEPWAKAGETAEEGLVLYYTAQCPFTRQYAPMLHEIAAKRDIPLKLIKLETRQAARQAPTPYPTYSFFADGRFVTNEIFSEKKCEKWLDEWKAKS